MNSKISEQLFQIEKRLEEIEKWKKSVKILCDQSKKPHKCPICEGLGGFISAQPTKICQACEGKGIIWG